MNPRRLTREVAFELPPLWDGLQVEWQGWSTLTVRLCPPPRPEPCERCASAEQPAHNVGVVHPAPLEDASFEDLANLYGAGKLAGSAHPIAWLNAFRCRACQIDSVLDLRTDEWWVLDESDYGRVGSADPRLF